MGDNMELMTESIMLYLYNTLQLPQGTKSVLQKRKENVKSNRLGAKQFKNNSIKIIKNNKRQKIRQNMSKRKENATNFALKCQNKW